jgi:nucleotide-binding universal stress UspA family protein
MEHIFCPVDFSEFSRAALHRAVTMARSEGAALTVLHVHPLAVSASAVPFGLEGPSAFQPAHTKPAETLEHLNAFVGQQAADVSPQLQVTDAPAVHREILAQAERVGADLIVIGTHGRSGFDRLLLGSTTERVLRSARVPVLTVPAAAPGAVQTPVPFSRVLCAVDFSEASRLVLAHAMALARSGGGRVTLVHVVELLPVAYEPMITPPFDAAQFRAAAEKAAEAQLQALVPLSAREMCGTHVTSAARAYEGILNTAADRQADVIVIGVHGRNMLDRLLFGSTTERVLRRAVCPVLTVRDDAVAAG